jgi:hypothetical protein
LTLPSFVGLRTGHKPVDAILLIIFSPCAIHAADHANHIGFPSGIDIDMPPGGMRRRKCSPQTFA